MAVGHDEDEVKRREFLLALSDALRDVADPVEVQAVASRLLGQHLKANRVAYAEIADREGVVSNDYVDGVASMVGRYPLEAWGQSHVEAWRRSDVSVVDDVQADPELPEAARESWRAIETAAYLATFLVKNGRWVAALGVHSRTPRHWTAAEVELTREVADRTWAAVERAQAEAALRKSEEMLRLVVENSRDGINMLDLATQKYVFLSPAQVALTGFTAEEMNGLSAAEAHERVHPDDRNRSIEQQQRVAAGLEPNGAPVEYRWRTKSGDYRWFSDSRKLVRDAQGRPVALVGVSRDITERKRLEEEAQARSRELLQALFEHIPILLVMWDPQIRRFTLNRETERVIGWSTAEVNEVDLLTRMYADPTYRADVAAYMRSLQPGFREFVGRAKTGEVIPIAWANVRLSDDTMVGIGVDLRERKRVEAALRESERRHSAMFEGAPFAIALTRASDRTLVSANAAFFRLFEISPGDALGRTNVDVHLCDSDYEPRLQRELATRGSVRDFECTQTTKSGNDLVLSLTVDRVMLDGEEHVLTTIRDLTDLRRAEERARLYEMSRERLLDLDAMERLHQVASLFFREEGPRGVLDAMLEAALAVTEADFGTIQILEPGSADLRIVSQRKLPSAWVDAVNRTSRTSGSAAVHDASRVALERGERVVVEDVTTSPLFAGTEALDVHVQAGVRALQATPLVGRSGVGLGVISTHYRAPHRPSERALRLLDLLARQAADMLERARSEAALRASETKYSGILANIADALISVDERHLVTEWNRGAESMFGYSRPEVLGGPLEILIPERYRAAHREQMAKFATEADSARAMAHQAAGLRKSGEEFPISAMISKFSIDGAPIMTVAVRDITEQRRFETEQRVLADVGAALTSPGYEAPLEAIARIAVSAVADVATIFTIEEGRVVRRVASTSRDPALQSCADVMMSLPDEPRAAHPFWQVLGSARPMLLSLTPEMYDAVAQSAEHLHALRTIRPKSALLVPMLAGGDCVGIFTLSSCSRHFDTRDLHLAEEIARRCAFFIENARLYRAERRAVRARDEVLGVVAHDLRNPLSAILLAAGSLRPSQGQPDRRNAKPLDTIARAGARMNRIVEDLLEVTRLETGELSMHPAIVSAHDLLNEVAESHAGLAREHRLELRVEAAPDLPDVSADKDRVHQIFGNLLGNAAKFAREGRISLGAKPRGEDVLFWVADTGSGIPPEHVPHVFDRFWQARETSRGGAGLGLAIAKGLVEAQGGRIWVESRVGVGSTFYFTLSVADGRRHEGTTGPRSAPRSLPR